MANKEPEKIAWDSCVIIDCLQRDEAGEYRWLSPLVAAAKAGELLVVASAVAIAETCFIKNQPPPTDLFVIDAFYDLPWVRSEAANITISRHARDLRRQFPIDGMDAIHAATALLFDAPVLLTQDGKSSKNKTPLLALDNKLTLMGKPHLRIRTPEQHHQIKLAEANPLLQTPT